MEMTLLLNATYEPLRVVHWHKAITLLWQGKVEVLEFFKEKILFHDIYPHLRLPGLFASGGKGRREY